jgi:hypothetical protein
MATDASDRERQRRELEEIRRKFTETSARMGSLFEPAPPDDQGEDVRVSGPALPPPDKPASRPRPRPGWPVVAAVVAALLVGTSLGYVLPRSQADAPASPPPASTQAPASTLAPRPRTVTSVPAACLETARKGDLTIHYLTINVRDQRLVQALKDYTLASQACRREASP